MKDWENHELVKCYLACSKYQGIAKKHNRKGYNNYTKQMWLRFIVGHTDFDNTTWMQHVKAEHLERSFLCGLLKKNNLNNLCDSI